MFEPFLGVVAESTAPARRWLAQLIAKGLQGPERHEGGADPLIVIEGDRSAQDGSREPRTD